VSELPRGRIPAIGMRELVAAIHRRRERRRDTVAELAAGIERLAASAEQHLARIAEVRQAIEAQGGDLSALEHHDTTMARLRAELRDAERSLGDAPGSAAQS
jgi:DNA-binding FadR family transcriptional regulator